MSTPTARPGEVTWDFDVEGAPPSYTPFQLTLSGLIFPYQLHWVFDAWIGVCLALLGHLYVGVAVALCNALADWAMQRRLNRLLLASPGADSHRGLRRLAWMLAGRSTLYIVGPAAAATLKGDARTVIYACIVAMTLVSMAIASGSFSKRVFWGTAGPAIVTVAAGCVVGFGPVGAAPLIAALASFCVTLGLISGSTVKVMNEWDGAHRKTVQLIGHLRTARDAAEAERAAADEAREEARRAHRAKSNFLATMSHEIRTPMNGVMGMAQLMRGAETDPRQVERIDTLIQSGEYLLSILNDILDISKIDAGKMDIQLRPEDLDRFARRLVVFWEGKAAEKGLDLRLHLDEAAPHHVLMDGLRVRQVLFNLIGNALKFTDAGEITVAVAAEPIDESHVRVRFSVSDTGLGIDPELAPVLFERFSQADDESAVRRYGGTGLGLAISKQLVELMGGTISVESAPGRGSTFHVRLPLAIAQGPATTGDEAAAAPVEPIPALRVLAVDDNDVNLLVLEQLLSAFGHQVTRATDGPEALTLLGAQAFDLVLMDIQMPRMTGIEALQRLRAADGPNRLTPVVALTADVVSGGRDKYLALGFSDHASKPIQIADLMAAVARAMDGAPAPRPSLGRDAA
ncbi:MAG: response regulator [Proteobacteria bacterium]|nr:response regulator [Pseudomonadota bacterium]